MVSLSSEVRCVIKLQQTGHTGSGHISPPATTLVVVWGIHREFSGTFARHQPIVWSKSAGLFPNPNRYINIVVFCLDQKVNMQEESGRYMSTILLHGYNWSRGSLLNSLHTTFETLRVQNIRNEIWFAKVACGAQPLHTFATPRQYFSEQNMKISLTFPAGNSCFGCNNGNSPPGIHQLHQP